MSTRSPVTATGSIDTSRILTAALASIGGAVVANIIARFLIGLFYTPPAGFTPLDYLSIIFFTVIGTGLGALVFWFLSKRSANPISTYRTIAIVALVLSIIPNILAAFNPSMFPMPGGDPTAFLVLILFHIIAAVVSFVILTSMVKR
jgi:H+/Cl- antiporter ClcA